MMIERIKAAISAQPSIADWRISEMRRSGAEWYFIGESLDSARAIEALDYRLSVYVTPSSTARSCAARPPSSSIPR
jgi:hypothetical protein